MLRRLLSLQHRVPSRPLTRFTTIRWLSTVPSILKELEHNELQVTKATEFKEKIPNEKLKFGASFTDHMLEIDWDNETGWHAPQICPYHKFEMDPACSVLHYAMECFEGTKAYLDKNGKIRMFRPEKNLERMNKSMERLFFPTFNIDEFLDCIKELLRVEKSWIPKGSGYSLYIRPTAISTQPFIGIAPASQVKLYVIMSPVGPYYPEGFSAISLYADDKYVRAWPGGSGNAKLGSNYAITIKPQMEAAAMGFTQILWLFGPEKYVTEVGTMNQFFYWKRKSDGKKELITAPLDGMILPGVTRQSILELTRDWNEFEVSERQYTIYEVIEAIEEGRMIESFGSGTAAVVSPVKSFQFQGKLYDIPLNPENPDGQAGLLTQKVWDALTDIQYGETPHKWSSVID